MGSDDDDDDNGWDEVMDDDQDVQCVFCNNSFPCTVALWEHCANSHQFKITDFKNKSGELLLTVMLNSICYSQLLYYFATIAM